MQQSKWRTILQKSTRDPQVMLADLGMGNGLTPLSRQSADNFPLRAPAGFLEKVRRGDMHDPLLRQILPLAEEDETTPGYVNDPLQEHASQPVPGLLHKYNGRALLIVTGACAIHCRYCFRRHFPYTDANASPRQWQLALDYLSSTPDITEIILSGGDPLTVSNDKLELLINELSNIAHLRRLRIHTRIPIVLPERIDDGLISILTGASGIGANASTPYITRTRLKPVIVVHANHANEIDDRVAGAIMKLREARIPLLNQSVLLKGVNDTAAVLQELSEKLFSTGIIPYYLHMLDPVQGTAHFAVSDERAAEIIKQLRERLPGYLVPRLVREVPGQAGKVPVG